MISFLNFSKQTLGYTFNLGIILLLNLLQIIKVLNNLNVLNGEILLIKHLSFNIFYYKKHIKLY